MIVEGKFKSKRVMYDKSLAREFIFKLSVIGVKAVVVEGFDDVSPFGGRCYDVLWYNKDHDAVMDYLENLRSDARCLKKVL